MNTEMCLSKNELVVNGLTQSDYDRLMQVYKQAINDLEYVLLKIKQEAKEFYEYDIISTITSRLKTPESIINKLKKKHYEVNCNNIINQIDDIAGIRVVCPFKNSIRLIRNIISEIPNITILQEKDYIENPKKSGYSGYHLIVEVPVRIGEDIVYVKAEIQIRTMAMDFWATTEHRIRYKSKSKVSVFDSLKLSMYARVLNKIDNQIMRIKNKQEI